MNCCICSKEEWDGETLSFCPRCLDEMEDMASDGDVDSQLLLGKYYSSESRTPDDMGRAVFFYKMAARNGNMYAQRFLAACYFEGLGTVRNPEKAKEWYEKSAKQGNPDAQYALGLLYLNTEYNEEISISNYEKALDWLKKSADQGNYEAEKMVANVERLMELKNIIITQKSKSKAKKKTNVKVLETETN